MIKHDLVQGTQEWLEFRKNMFNASEAAAMLGLSKKVTRNELLHMKKTGSAQAFSEWVQKNILDYGHEVEALARPIVEKAFEIDLYPITVSEGKISASLDGITLDDQFIFEHKQLNAELKEALSNDVLPDEYMPQLQQQLMITGAEKALFVASDGTEESMLYTWVHPQKEWIDRILQGWTQFAIDYDAYEPVIAPIEPEPEPIMGLPALVVRTRGEVLESNLSAYKAAASQYIANIKTELQTDEDFANAEENVKFCDKAEKDLEAAKSATIAQASSIDEVMRTIDFIQAELRSKRLSLEKLVKHRKEAIKKEIIDAGIEALKNHISSIEAEISPMRMPLAFASADFYGAAKNKRTLSSLQNAVDTELANAKIKADAAAKDIRGKLAWQKQNCTGYEFLFNDLQQLIQKPMDDFQLAAISRIHAHKKAEEEKAEAQRKQIQAEEQAKAEAKVRAEQEEIVRKEIEAEMAKQKAEQLETIREDKRRFEAQSKPPVVESVPVVAESAQVHETRPSDQKIIEVLADHFSVEKTKVIEWIFEMDLQGASDFLSLDAMLS